MWSLPRVFVRCERGFRRFTVVRTDGYHLAAQGPILHRCPGRISNERTWPLDPREMAHATFHCFTHTALYTSTQEQYESQL